MTLSVQCYSRRSKPINLRRSTPKTGNGENLHRTISCLMSHIITKLLLRVVTNRARKAIKPETDIVQYGFVKHGGTPNAVFVTRMIGESMIQAQKPLFVCFVDHTKVFDKVQYVLWATKSEGVGLIIVRAISFQDFQPIWSRSTNVTDRQTDGQTDGRTTCDRNTALCTIVHRAIKILDILQQLDFDVTNLRYYKNNAICACFG